MLAVALGVVPVAMGFFIAAALVILASSITLREAYNAIDWPILIMLGALIPVSDAAQSTGLTDSDRPSRLAARRSSCRAGVMWRSCC
jgi:di/tricarboxylate transporter